MARIEGIAEQAEMDRELKRTELETDRESKLSSEIELEKLKYSFETKHLELMGQLEVQRASFKTELEKQKSEKLTHARDPKLSYFEESKDKMDSYLSRFEKYATANKWDKNVWVAYLSALLKGRALDVYDRLSTEDAADYDKLTDTLLKNFDMTEQGFRKKFRYSRQERSETFIQFSSRLLFAASAFRKLSSFYVFSYFPFGFEGRIWDLIVSVPDHCLSFYFVAI